MGGWVGRRGVGGGGEVGGWGGLAGSVGLCCFGLGLLFGNDPLSGGQAQPRCDVAGWDEHHGALQANLQQRGGGGNKGGRGCGQRKGWLENLPGTSRQVHKQPSMHSGRQEAPACNMRPLPDLTWAESWAMPTGPSAPASPRTHRLRAPAVDPRPAGATSRTITAAGARQHSLRHAGTAGWGL